MIIGGIYDSLSPIKIEPSTSIPNIVSGARIVKVAANDADGQLDSGIIIDGSGVVNGGKAEVVFENVDVLAQNNGRKEILSANNANVKFGGKIKYDATLSNAVCFLLDNGSHIALGDVEVDFSGSTAATPMLVRYADGNSSAESVGPVTIYNSNAANSFVVLADFGNNAGSATFRDVKTDGNLFGGDGWRNDGAASYKMLRVEYLDVTISPPNVISVSFSSGSGGKVISWPDGCGHKTIYVAVNATAAGTFVGNISDGAFVGQRCEISNVSASLTFDVDSTPFNLAPAATRTVQPGASLPLVWNGAAWAA